LFLQILPGARQRRHVVPAQLGHHVSCAELFGCRSRTMPISPLPVAAPVPADWCCSVLDFRFGRSVFFGSRFSALAPAREYPSRIAECAPRGLAPCLVFVASPSPGARPEVSWRSVSGFRVGVSVPVESISPSASVLGSICVQEQCCP
jgi:hypothetical protein